MTAPSDPQQQIARVREYFAGEAGKDRYLALLGFTERQIRAMRWCVATDDGSIPGGRQANDIVNGVVQALLLENPDADGRREIPPHIAFDYGIKTIIDSELNHAAVSFENRRRQDPETTDREGKPVDLLDSPVPFWDPSSANLTPEQTALAAARSTRFIEFAKRDKIVCAMLMLIRDQGIDRPAERIAKELGIKVPEVYAARKRLGTLVRKFGKSAPSP
jgi:hypothetical protein